MCATESKAWFSAENRNRMLIFQSRHNYRASKSCRASIVQLARASDVFQPYPPCEPCSVSLMPGPTVSDADADNSASSVIFTQSVHTVCSEANDALRALISATETLWPTFANHRIYQLQPTETKNAPNVVWLLSAETKCHLKVPIHPHSAPKSKLKPKFGRPRVVDLWTETVAVWWLLCCCQDDSLFTAATL